MVCILFCIHFKVLFIEGCQRARSPIRSWLWRMYISLDKSLNSNTLENTSIFFHLQNVFQWIWRHNSFPNLSLVNYAYPQYTLLCSLFMNGFFLFLQIPFPSTKSTTPPCPFLTFPSLISQPSIGHVTMFFKITSKPAHILHINQAFNITNKNNNQ